MGAEYCNWLQWNLELRLVGSQTPSIRKKSDYKAVEEFNRIKFDKIVHANFSVKRLVFLFHINDFQGTISCHKTEHPYENFMLSKERPT